ncbi:MAG: PLP-dependent aminotransferase family protein [Alphaproteobacteria bacterium]
MTKQVEGLLLDMITLDRDGGLPLYRQLDSQLRRAVLSGRLPPETRLPATRQLALELGISRLTVQNTYEQLVAEGFLKAVAGAGTFVAEIPPEDLPPTMPAPVRQMRRRRSGLSRRGEAIATTRAATRVAETRPFRPGVPDPDLFPMAVWSRLWARAFKRAGRDLFGYGPEGGCPALRTAISEHLGNARGVRCDPEQVIVTAGSQQSFALSALALLDAGDLAWGEDPGHAAGRDVLNALGVRVAPVSIDDEGLEVATARTRFPAPRLICVTPSHQHPLGVTMSLRRRLELLQFAQRIGAWILEDDYDSEFRYSGRPLQALQGLDSGGCVIYAGSFSKVLYPSLRMGYLVVPHDLVEAYGAAQRVLSQGIPLLPQLVLADFMREGRYAAHIRRMRMAYGERQRLLVAALQRRARDLIEVQPTAAGMHLVAWLRNGRDDLQAARTLWQAGIEAIPLSIYAVQDHPRGGLLLGFTAVAPELIDPKVKQLVAALEAVAQ